MKLGRKLVSLLLALVMVFSLTATASAAATETVTVKLSPNITVTLDGEPQAMADVKGNPVYPVLYGGTTYLPVRAVGNMLGLDVDWDQATQTVLLTTSNKETGNSTGGKTTTTAQPTDITVSINPNITVKLDGEVQKMTNVNGDPVYPMLYGGTTYLPVRAVSNMLMVDVEWDGATQTVILDNSFGTLTVDENGDAIVAGTTYEQLYRTLKHFQVPQNIIDLNLTESTKEASDRFKAQGGGVTMTVNLGNNHQFEALKTLGKDHIGYEWVELDYSTASEGYIRVKVNEQTASYTRCTVGGYDENGKGHSNIWTLVNSGEWYSIPLTFGNGDYMIGVYQVFSGKESEEELSKLRRLSLNAKFTAKFDNPNAPWLLSYFKVDYENAPNTVAKAKELTENCKTDAEKIAVIYNYVSTAIRYDNSLWNEIKAYNNRVNTDKDFHDLFKNGARQSIALDGILSSGKGVCEDYAVLMAGMLRSVGIPCKVVSGDVNYDGEWVPHDWVAVKPETGTLSISGMGKDYAGTGFDENFNKVPADPTGWIRLDPTNSNYPSLTSNDNNYRTDEYR